MHWEPSPRDTPRLYTTRATQTGHSTSVVRVCNLFTRGKTLRQNNKPESVFQAAGMVFWRFFMHLNAGPDLCSDESLCLLKAASARRCCSARCSHQSPHSALEGKVQVQLFCFCCAAGFEESSKFPKPSQKLIRPVHGASEGSLQGAAVAPAPHWGPPCVFQHYKVAPSLVPFRELPQADCNMYTLLSSASSQAAHFAPTEQLQTPTNALAPSLNSLTQPLFPCLVCFSTPPLSIRLYTTACTSLNVLFLENCSVCTPSFPTHFCFMPSSPGVYCSLNSFSVLLLLLSPFFYHPFTKDKTE